MKEPHPIDIALVVVSATLTQYPYREGTSPAANRHNATRFKLREAERYLRTHSPTFVALLKKPVVRRVNGQWMVQAAQLEDTSVFSLQAELWCQQQNFLEKLR